MISESSIEEVKLRIDIVDVIGDFVQLKKSGANYKALSPFTDEKTPSFYVSPVKNLYKCFSSGKGGDAINFVMEHEGFTFYETIRFLAKKYNVELEENETDDMKAERSEREALLIALKFANDLYQELLWEHDEGKSVGLGYFRERGLNDHTIQNFELGYSLDLWDHLMNTAVEKGYNKEILEKAGLIIRKENGKEYDRFRNRTIFPIHNITGRVVGFGARQIKNEKKQPKYVNSPESEVYNKSKVLYGLYQAKQEVRNKDLCYLVEGYMDVIALSQAGVHNVVASSGTSLTDEQVSLISRYTQNITVLFDGDSAGVKAALRGVDMIIEKGLNVHVVMFPDGHDPDSYLQEVGSQQFEEYLTTHSKDFIDFKADLYLEGTESSAENKVHAVREIVDSISKIPDSIARSLYIKEAATKFGLEEGVLYAEVNKIILQKRKKDRAAEQYKEENLPIPPEALVPQTEGVTDIGKIIKIQERECLRLLLTYGLEPEEEFGFYYTYYFNETEDVEYQDSVVREVVGLYKESLKNNDKPSLEYFIAVGSDEVKNLVAELYFEKYELSENWMLKYKIVVLKEFQVLDQVFPRNILLLKYRFITQQLHEQLDKLRDAKEEEKDELMDRFMLLKQFQKEYAEELGIIVNPSQ